MIHGRFEHVILKLLLDNEEYMRKAYPFLKSEYFSDVTERRVFTKIADYIGKYNARPSKESILIEFGDDDLITEEYDAIAQFVSDLDSVSATQGLEWLIDKTEKWCQDSAIFNAIQSTIKIYEGTDQKRTKHEIPQLLSDALGVSFDSDIGHDYINGAAERFDFYNEDLARIPFDLEMFNVCTEGGTPNGTLNVILAGTNVGKSLGLSHMAAAALTSGKNVLYITMEDAEKQISKRLDANLLNVESEKLKTYGRQKFVDRFTQRVANKTNGKLFVKQYPTSTPHSGHFRHLLNELKLKKSFVPDIIFIDYINICASSRTRLGGSVNTNSFVKAIAEELRGLAMEFDVPIWTATQTNRSGYNSSDVDLDDTAESFGLPQTADFMVSFVQTEELAELDQFLVKQLKNRYRDKNKNKRFVIGVDKDKQRLYDVDQSQAGILEDGTVKGKSNEDDVPAFDRGSFGSRMGKQGPEKEYGFNFNA